MVKSVNMTAPGIKSYPMHRHSFSEIMYYAEGVGFLKTECGDYPFSPGTAILVPKGILHGSTSEDGFKNISVGGDFDRLIVAREPISIPFAADAKALSELIYKNRFDGSQYLTMLVDCYLTALMQAYRSDSQIAAAVRKIKEAIAENSGDPEFSVAAELNCSGYAEDYIRAKFKEICKDTPTEFLNRLRIKNACRMIEIYGDTISMTEVATKAGFSNPAYFSRIFKKTVGISPRQYRKNKGTN